MADLLAHIAHHQGFLSPELAQGFFTAIHAQTTWHQELTNQEGKKQPLKRLMAYASDTGADYGYAGLLLPGQGWTPALQTLLTQLNAGFGYDFNSVLLNLYRHGRDVINFHSDKEAQLGENPVIATVNLGATRTFHFLDKESGARHQVVLENGDLLLMLEHCQQLFLHAILKESEVTEPRISLTFRKVHPIT